MSASTPIATVSHQNLIRRNGPEGDIAPTASHTEIKYRRRLLRGCLDARSITDHNRPFGDHR